MHSAELMTKITVVYLVFLSVCRSAQSLKTGYEYPRDVSVPEDILYKDLKCTYLYGAVTHMSTTRHLTGATFLSQTKSALRKIMHYARVLRYQLDSLYRLKITHMSSLWLLHLYMGMMNGFYDDSPNKKKDGQHIRATHDYVIAELLRDLTDCREDNSFDSYRRTIGRNSNPSEQELIDLMNANIAEATELLTTNNICGQPLSENVGNTFKMGCLLLNNLGVKDVFKDDLMDVYNVQVDWFQTSSLLAQSWHDGRTLYWTTEKFASLKTYYKLSFDFLKIIMFRLTLKHLCYLEAIVEKNLYVRYAKEWYDMFVEFSDTLRLSQDLHVQHLKISLVNLVKEKEPIHSVVNYLIAILETLCLPLGCVATKEFILNGREFQIPYKSSTKDEIDDFRVTKSSVPIEYHSLENTRSFLHYLGRVFRYVDFNLIRLLIEYINVVDS